MEVSVEMIKELRFQTGAGIMDCKRALEEGDGDFDKAQELLREQGIEAAAKKLSRVTDQGAVEAYIHSGGRIGAMVEVNCETDFVARTPEFKSLAHDLAMQVAAMSPIYVDSSDIPEGDDVDPQVVCLMQQPYIKDPTRAIKDLVMEGVSKLGENVKIRRFSRFSLGG